MAGKINKIFSFSLLIPLLFSACSKTDNWNVAAVKTMVATTDVPKKEKIFNRKILPYIKARHSVLLQNFENCSGSSLTEECFIPIIRSAVLKELKSASDSATLRKTVELYKIVTKDSLAEIPENREAVDSISIAELKTKLASNEEVPMSELISLVLILPEEKSVIANLQGLLCSDLKSEPEAVSRKRALETLNAAF